MRVARCVRQHHIGPIALFIDRRPPVDHRARDAREPVTTDRVTRTERRAARSERVRRRQRRFGALLGVVSLACGGALLASAAEPSEALAASWSTGVEASLPAGAGSSPDVEIPSVSCASAGNCSAVGNYYDSSGNRQGLLLSESGGTWSAGVKATLPAGAGSDPGVHLSSVSCASAGNCSAVGYYIDSSGNRQGLLLSESGGTWSTGAKMTPPGDAGPDPHVSLYSVSCASAGNCSAVGNYFDVGDTDSSGYQLGLVLSESGGSWSAGAKATLPDDAATAPDDAYVNLYSVSCASAGNCSAVGNYVDSSGDRQGLLLSESGGSWSAGAKATPPAEAAANPDAYSSSVSCASAGDCSAVGSYYDSSVHRQGLLLSESGGSWSAGAKATPPAEAGFNPYAYLPSVSCASAGNCSAVGYYADGSGYEQGLLLSESGGSWSTGAKATLPAGSGSHSGANLYSVSCASAGDCSAVGFYGDSSNHRQGLLLSESGGTWSAGVEATLPANAGSSPDVEITSVSCASAGDCSAVGRYYDSSGHQQGLLLGESGGTLASPALSVSAPSTGTVGSAISSSSVSAALSGGSSPTAAITFTVFGPQSTAPTECSAGGTTVGTATVSGNETYNPSGGFTPPSAGDYWWYARYGGDSGNNPASSTCGAAMAETVVTDGGGGGGGGAGGGGAGGGGGGAGGGGGGGEGGTNPNPTPPGATGQRAAALKKCKNSHAKRLRKSYAKRLRKKKAHHALTKPVKRHLKKQLKNQLQKQLKKCKRNTSHLPL